MIEYKYTITAIVDRKISCEKIFRSKIVISLALSIHISGCSTLQLELGKIVPVAKYVCNRCEMIKKKNGGQKITYPDLSGRYFCNG